MDNELIIKNNELVKYTNCDDMTWKFAFCRADSGEQSFQ